MLSVISNIDYNIFYSLLFQTTIKIDYRYHISLFFGELSNIDYFFTFLDINSQPWSLSPTILHDFVQVSPKFQVFQEDLVYSMLNLITQTAKPKTNTNIKFKVYW